MKSAAFDADSTPKSAPNPGPWGQAPAAGQADQPADSPAQADHHPADGFALAIAAIMALPLSDAEKAEAVRRLLAGKGGK